MVGAASAAGVTTTQVATADLALFDGDHDLTSTNFGTAHSNRLMVFCINAARNSATTPISGVSIGGVTATQAVNADDDSIIAEIWTAAVPTGTSGTINVTSGDTSYYVGWTLYSVIGGTGTPTLHASDSGVVNGSVTFSSLAVSADECLIATHSTRSGSSKDITWAGTDTETRQDTDPEPDRYGQTMHVDISTTETADLTFTDDGADNHAYCYAIFEDGT